MVAGVLPMPVPFYGGSGLKGCLENSALTDTLTGGGETVEYAARRRQARSSAG